MNPKALSNDQLEKYLSFLSIELGGKYISSPICYTRDTFVFHLSNKKYHSLTICLDASFPRIYLSSNSLEGSSLEDNFLKILKKELSNSCIEKVIQYNNDRIIKTTLSSINSVFKEEEKHLYLELLPHHPNMILTDKNDVIVAAFRASSLEDKRPVIRGLLYMPLENPFTKGENTHFSLEDFQKDCLNEEINLAAKRKKERFGYAFTFFKNREKTLKRKITYLENDREEAKKHINDNLKGDAIYICYSSINNRQGSFFYDGLEVELDPSRTLSNNAERYYKRSKKAKETILQCNKFLAEAENELKNVQDAIAQMSVANETGLELLSKEFNIPLFPTKKDKQKCYFSSDTVPFYIDLKGTKILFGKSAKQNAFLSFMYDTSKEHYWFHIAKTSGSHVIIKKNDPNEEEIRVAAEICLINSSQEDGDVVFTKRKNIKKGHALGEAILKEYQTIHLKRVSEETKKYLSSAKRISLH